MEKFKRHLGPVICERLQRMLPYNTQTGWYILPDKTEILVGVEYIYAQTSVRPFSCDIDLGGDIPFTVWK